MRVFVRESPSRLTVHLENKNASFYRHMVLFSAMFPSVVSLFVQGAMKTQTVLKVEAVVSNSLKLFFLKDGLLVWVIKTTVT